MYLAGFVLVGVAVFRAGVLPAGAALLLVVGVLHEAAPLPGMGHGLTIVVHNAGLAWMGLGGVAGMGARGGAAGAVGRDLRSGLGVRVGFPWSSDAASRFG